MLVGGLHNLWSIVAAIGLAGAAHQGWSANIFTVASDVFPRAAVGSVTGIAGFGGAVGGMMVAWLVGVVLENYHSYSGIFAVSGMAYLGAWIVLQLMIPAKPLVIA